jgi:signal transduction histidine kinase/ActR/RegA family two-component response regulator
MECVVNPQSCEGISVMTIEHSTPPRLQMLRGETLCRSFQLEGDSTSMGRDPTCSIVLRRKTVSREHARIVRRRNGYFLEDLGSAGGTQVNGRTTTGAVRLRDGDLIHVGDCLFRFSGSLLEVRDEDDGRSAILGVLDASEVLGRQLVDGRPEIKLRELLEIGQELAAPRELKQVLETILSALFRIFPQAGRGFVLLKDDEHVELVPRAFRLRGDDSGELIICRTIFNHVLGEGKAVLSLDVRSDARFSASRSAQRARIRTLMCVPLWDHRRRPVGILQVDTQDVQARFGPEDLELLAAVAGPLSVAVENARLLEAAQAACRAKDRILAVLGHELRTPLTPILAAVSARLENETDPERSAELEMIRRNIELEARLIDDLLDISRIERGRLNLELEVVDLHEVVRKTVEICRDELLVAGLRLDLKLAAARPHVKGDHARLMQIAWNLVHNAAKFTPAGGTLTIRTFNAAAVDSPAPADRLVIEFQDDGQGIESEMLPRIFEPFEQGRAGVHSRAAGLGLGLSICQSLTSAHGGTLEASSPGPGLGSTFRLVLGCVPAPASPAGDVPCSNGPSPHRTLRILLVEDNRDTLRFLALILGQRGHTVETATSLEEARAKLSGALDLLISDIELPDGSGLDLMREVAARHEFPGIAMSGFGSEEDLRFSRGAGFAAHLTKPIDIARLETAIQQYGPQGDHESNGNA